MVAQRWVALATMDVTCPLTKPGRSTTVCIPLEDSVATSL